MVKYCSSNGCGFANSYTVNPPTKCGKCHTSFAAAFKITVAEEETEDEMVIVRKLKKAVASKPMQARPTALQKLRQAQAQARIDAGEESEVEDEEILSDEEDSDDGLLGTSASTLAASLNPDDMIRFSDTGNQVKLGDWCGKPKS